jgi:hypothetical protein
MSSAEGGVVHAAWIVEGRSVRRARWNFMVWIGRLVMRWVARWRERKKKQIKDLEGLRVAREPTVSYAELEGMRCVMRDEMLHS